MHLSTVNQTPDGSGLHNAGNAEADQQPAHSLFDIVTNRSYSFHGLSGGVRIGQFRGRRPGTLGSRWGSLPPPMSDLGKVFSVGADPVMMAGVHCVHVFPQLSGGLVTT